MGFTPDQLPAIGLLRPRVIVVAGFNGYGLTYTTAAGEAAAIMSLTGKAPDWVPEDVFSPCRFLHDEPLFMRAHESLWRIAASLCQQLRTVEAQTAEGLAFAGSGLGDQTVPSPSARSRWRRSAVLSSSPRPAADAEQLRQFATFRQFELDELTELVTLMRRWEAPENTLLFAEGSAGRSCFVVLSGTVEVSTVLGGRQRRFASLGPGSGFGQVSLIDGRSRSANCLMRHAGVLLEMEQDPCARLFESRSPTALKFLAAVNHGLIAALRGADRRLMRLQDDGRPAAGSEVPSITEVIPLGELAAWGVG